MIPSVLLVTLLLASSSLHTTAFANAASVDRENEVKSILHRMESDALAFRDEIGRVYIVRCEAQTLTECFESNYNDCSPTFPNQKCMAVDELVISACGDGKSCNNEYSFKLVGEQFLSTQPVVVSSVHCLHI